MMISVSLVVVSRITRFLVGLIPVADPIVRRVRLDSMVDQTNIPGKYDDRGHRVVRISVSVFLVSVVVFVSSLQAQSPQGSSFGLGDLSLAAIENSPETSTESTIVEIPVPITLRAPKDGKIGIRLRLSVFFSWNNVRFVDIEGDDIVASLQTLTIVPGVEFMIPVGERWMVRPYGQIGGLQSLDVPGHRWMASLGSRASGFWPFEKWILSAGGRLDYTAVFDDDWRHTDDVAFVDLGGDFSFPLWFNVMGERAAAGFFVMPRYYISPAEVVGQDGFDLGVDSHIEIGASFQIHDNPKLWFIKIPKWYGLGVRLAENHRSLRIYLGFPF